jgi:hypothetical protein
MLRELLFFCLSWTCVASYGLSPLMLAARDGRIDEAVDLLRASAADVNAVASFDGRVETALSLAFDAAVGKPLRALDVALKSIFANLTHEAVTAAVPEASQLIGQLPEQDLRLVDALLDAGAHGDAIHPIVTQWFRSQCSSLCQAVLLGRESLVSKLVVSGRGLLKGCSPMCSYLTW